MQNKLPPFAEIFFDKQKPLLEEIYALEAKRHLKLIKRIVGDKDEVNFYSWLSEVRVGLFFDNLCDTIEYSPNMHGKTPDWRVSADGCEVVAEVLRLNTNELELRESIDLSKQLHALWNIHPGLSVNRESEARSMSSHNFYGMQSKLQLKIHKYQSLIDCHKTPFVLCITPTMDTFINESDTFDFLIGRSKQGFFYTDEIFGKYTAGVLLYTFWGQWFFFNNEKALYPVGKGFLQLLPTF